MDWSVLVVLAYLVQRTESVVLFPQTSERMEDTVQQESSLQQEKGLKEAGPAVNINEADGR